MNYDESPTFSSLGLPQCLLQTLEDKNFTTPSAIQAQTIPEILRGRDIIGQSQTGTGKTAAFALPILATLKLEVCAPQALILAPTRELAIQVAEHFEELTTRMPGVRIAVLCGGQDYRPQLQKLRAGVHIVVGTPGRILDHLERQTLQLSTLNTFVLDEADEMLRMGFIEDVETILAALPAGKQMVLFSATMPSRIRQIATRYLNNPASIEIRAATATVKNIAQKFIFASQPQKPEALLRVLAAEDYQGVIVFARTKSRVDEIAEMLQKHSYNVMAIHGDLSQPLRERIISQFRQGTIDILVATDVAARGLDVDRVTHVINYDIVQDCETYIHRIGRTGRAGRTGATILFVTPKETRMLHLIERHTRQSIEKIRIPSDEFIRAVQQQRFLKKITDRLEHKNLNTYRDMIQGYIKENSVELLDVAAALALCLNNNAAWEANIKFNIQSAPSAEYVAPSNKTNRSRSKPKQNHSSNHSSNHSQELFRLEVGRVHGAKPSNIVGAIANEGGLQSRFITALKIHDEYSTVCLPKGMAKEVVHGLKKAWVCGRQLNLTSLGVA